MENRWAERMEIHVPTLLEKGDGRCVNAVIRNISTGLYVETDQPPDEHSCIDVSVLLRNGGGTYAHKAPAIVTYTRNSGAGLMFSAVDCKMFSALNNLTNRRVRGSLRFDRLRSM